MRPRELRVQQFFWRNENPRKTKRYWLCVVLDGVAATCHRRAKLRGQPQYHANTLSDGDGSHQGPLCASGCSRPTAAPPARRAIRARGVRAEHVLRNESIIWPCFERWERWRQSAEFLSSSRRTRRWPGSCKGRLAWERFIRTATRTRSRQEGSAMMERIRSKHSCRADQSCELVYIAWTA